jgi:hypothetical protein
VKNSSLNILIVMLAQLEGFERVHGVLDMTNIIKREKTS